MKCDSLPTSNIQDLCVIELAYFHYMMRDVCEILSMSVIIWNMIQCFFQDFDEGEAKVC